MLHISRRTHPDRNNYKSLTPRRPCWMASTIKCLSAGNYILLHVHYANSTNRNSIVMPSNMVAVSRSKLLVMNVYLHTVMIILKLAALGYWGPTNVVRVRFPVPASYVGWGCCCCWLFPCSERFLSGYSGFPLSSKTNTAKSQFDLNAWTHVDRPLERS